MFPSVARYISLAKLHIVERMKGKGGIKVKIIVYYPKTLEKQAAFDARVAKFHAEYVAQYVEKLNCPTDQKLRLLDAVAQTVLAGAEKKDKKGEKSP